VFWISKVRRIQNSTDRRRSNWRIRAFQRLGLSAIMRCFLYVMELGIKKRETLFWCCVQKRSSMQRMIRAQTYGWSETPLSLQTFVDGLAADGWRLLLVLQDPSVTGREGLRSGSRDPVSAKQDSSVLLSGLVYKARLHYATTRGLLWMSSFSDSASRGLLFAADVTVLLQCCTSSISYLVVALVLQC
jgi:hypothetical protein